MIELIFYTKRRYFIYQIFSTVLWWKNGKVNRLQEKFSIAIQLIISGGHYGIILYIQFKNYGWIVISFINRQEIQGITYSKKNPEINFFDAASDPRIMQNSPFAV